MFAMKLIKNVREMGVDLILKHLSVTSRVCYKIDTEDNEL